METKRAKLSIQSLVLQSSDNCIKIQLSEIEPIVQLIPQTHPQCSGIAPPPISAKTLAEVLARPDIWRGDALATAPRPGVSTGFAALDAELPGGGWPRGAVVELMSRHSGIGEMALLMPALAAQFSGSNTGWTVCIAPPLLPFAPGWASSVHAIALQRLMVIRARGDDAAWACARALDTEGVAAVLAWLPNSRATTIRRLQLLAERSEALVFVFRPCACATQSSPAPLRLMLEASSYFDGGETGISRSTASRLRSGSAALSRDSTLAPTDVSTSTALAVHLIKRRGAGRAAPLYLKVPRPRRQSDVLSDLLPVERKPVPLPQVYPHVVAEPAISAISA